MLDTQSHQGRTESRAESVTVGASALEWKGAMQPVPAVIRGTYCRLEPLHAAIHAAQLFEANAASRNGTMWTHLPYGPFHTLDEYRAWIESRSGRSDPQFYAVISSEAGTAVGVAAYMRIDPANGSIEIGGLAYSPALQATRASTEAAYLLLRNAFELGYRRVEWKCDASNIASRRAAQRFGMSFEGIFRQSGVMKGRNRDTAWYSMLDREWPAVDTAFRQWLAPTNFTDTGRQITRLSEATRALLASADEFAPRLGAA